MPKLKNPFSKKNMYKEIEYDKVVSQRILILAGAIFTCFLIIFIRLFFLQVVQHDEYVEKKDDYTSIRQYVSAPRGEIYDCKGRVLAKTVVSHNIVYTSPKNMSQDDYWLYANRCVEVFGVDKKDLTERDIKEAYITFKSFKAYDDPEYAGNDLLSEKELAEYRSGAWGTNAETIRYGLLYNRITDKQIDEMSDKELKACVIYQRMIANTASGQENVILEDVSDTDVAYLVEHKTEFPGFDVDFGGWKREYPYGEALSDVIGSVSTSTEGLPQQYKTYYLQKGYQLNAPVGKSGIEFQYNDLLAGISEESIITYNSKGLAKKEVVREAVKGYDIHLSIDIDLQETLDATLKSVLKEKGGTEKRENFQSLFMCVMDPNDGAVKAMSGYHMDLETKQMTYYASGNYNSLINPGSSVKGATVYMGLSEGVIKPGDVIIDKVMNIAGEEFGSFKEHGPVDDITALAVSSNVYMFNIAIRLAHGSYVEGQPLSVVDVPGTLELMRQYFTMFGLGNRTGLDVPGEISGYMSVSSLAGMLLNYSIGQYDMCTPVQMLEYVSTIATSGKMYQPRLVTHATEVNSEEVVMENSKVLRNVLPEKNKEYLKRVQQGFRRVVSDGNASNALRDSKIPVSGKTGTAEVQEWTTAMFVGYAPSDNPNMAFACAAPTSSINTDEVAANICTTEVVPRIVEKFFELYPQ